MEITFYRKLANKLADAVVNNHKYSEAEEKKIRYGLVCIFSDLYKFILLLIIFFLLSSTKEFLIAFIGVLVFRPVLGGYHARSEIACIFISLFTMLVSVYVGKLSVLPLPAQVIIFACLTILGVVIAPVRTKQISENNMKYKILAAFLTPLAFIFDYFLFDNQVLSISTVLIYMFAVLQFVKNSLNGGIYTNK